MAILSGVGLGVGLSLLVSVKAVVEVDNSCFERVWKISGEDTEYLGIDIMSHGKNISCKC